MNKFLIAVTLFLCFDTVKAQQNLIKNSSFEYLVGDTSNMSYILFYDSLITCYALSPGDGRTQVTDWMIAYQSPDGYSTKVPSNSIENLPIGLQTSHYVYPHSGNNCFGASPYAPTASTNFREIIEGKLAKPLIGEHRYVFSIWLQLMDTLYSNFGGGGQYGKIVGINSYSAYFSDTIIPYHPNSFPITNYTPQVQINTMVTDTQHWVQLRDTFVCNEASAGAKYVLIGNFKTDLQTQTQLVANLRPGGDESYYFYDDVSLIDLDSSKGVGMEDLAMSNERLVITPNPCSNELRIRNYELGIKKVEVVDVLGRELEDLKMSRLGNEIQIQVSDLASGIYFLKITDDKGFQQVVKFVKE